MAIDESVWSRYQELLGYTDEEMKAFKENPANVDVVSKAPELMQKTVVLEVVDSHGCASQHKVGDKFYFDGSGNLLTKLCPSRVCVDALSSGFLLIGKAMELFFAGVDPNEMRFKRTGCHDVGVQCGGWGHITMEISVEDRKKS